MTQVFNMCDMYYMLKYIKMAIVLFQEIAVNT